VLRWCLMGTGVRLHGLHTCTLTIRGVSSCSGQHNMPAAVLHADCEPVIRCRMGQCIRNARDASLDDQLPFLPLCRQLRPALPRDPHAQLILFGCNTGRLRPRLLGF